MSEYTQGIYADGAAILKDGVMMTIEEILEELRQAALQSGEPVAYWNKNFTFTSFIKLADHIEGETPAGWIPLYTTPQPMVPECLEQFRDFVVDRQFWQIAKINNGNAPLYVTEIEYNALRNLLSAGKGGEHD